MDPTLDRPSNGQAAGDVAQPLAAAAAQLAIACGLEPDPAVLGRESMAATRDQGLGAGPAEPLAQLADVLAAAGMRTDRIHCPVREAVRHARDDRAMVMARAQGTHPDFLVVSRSGWSRAWVEGPGTERARVSLSTLEQMAGSSADTSVTWLAVQRDLPAESLTAGPPPGPPGSGSDGWPPGHGDGHGGDHRHHPTPFQRIRALAHLERSDLWSLLGYAVVTGLLYLAVPLAADALVSNISFGGQQRVYLQALVVLSVVLAVFLILHATVRALAFTVIERLQRRLFVRFTADLAVRLPRVCQSEFDRHHGPELTNRFFDIMTLQKAAAQLLLDGLDVVLTFLIGSLVLALYDWTLFWFDAGLLFLVLLVIWRFGRGGIQSSIEESRAKYATAGWLQQVALFSTVFKAPGGRDLAAERADGFARWYLQERQSHFRILFRQVLGLLAVEVLATVALLGWGGILVLNGQLSVGQLVASQLILTATLAAVAKFGKQIETAYDCLTAIDKVGHLVDLPVEPDSGDAPRQTPPAGMEVVIDRIAFEYVAHRPVFQNISLRIPSGARVAIVAEASSGSSTLVDLLYGLHTPTAGHIDLDGLDLRHWNRQSLRRQVARVHGDDDIFDGSLLDNVRLGNEAVGMAEAREALEAVNLLRKVQGMKGGLNEPLSLLGRSLSGTERRQVLLARAIVAQPRLLLLDATLDGFEPEEIDRILEYLKDPRRPWTLIVVTRDPDVIRRFESPIGLRSGNGSATSSPAPHGH